MTPTRRSLLLAGLATAAGTARAQDRPPFVVATYGGLFEKILRDRVIPAFEGKHGVRVLLELGIGTTFLPKLVAAGRRRAPYDVVYVNDDEAVLGQMLGLWAPDLSSDMPNVSRLYPSLRPSAALPLYTTVIYDFPLLYRTSMPTPKSWGDLWTTDRPVGIPHVSNSYGLTFLLIAALLNGGNAANLAPAFPALKRLRNPKIWRGVTDGVALFQRGEAEAGLMYNHRSQQLIDLGLPLATARPEEGVWGQRTGVQVPKTAANPALSAAWADLVLGPEAQAAFAEELYSPSNPTAPVSPKVAPKLLSGQDKIASLRFPDWQAINPQRDALADQWARTMGG